MDVGVRKLGRWEDESAGISGRPGLEFRDPRERQRLPIAAYDVAVAHDVLEIASAGQRFVGPKNAFAGCPPLVISSPKETLPGPAEQFPLPSLLAALLSFGLTATAPSATAATTPVRASAAPAE